MDKTLFEVTGQKAAINTIYDILERENSIVIESEYGMGKSTLINEIFDQKRSQHLNCYKITQDPFTLNKEYAPLLDFLKKNHCLDSLPQRNIFDSVPYIGAAVDTLVINSKHRNVASTIEQTLLLAFDEICGSHNKTYFFCEDMDSWDDLSIKFIYNLIYKKLDLKAFNRIIFIITINTNTSNRYLQELGPVQHCLKKIPKNLIPHIAKYLKRDKNLNKEQYDFIYMVSKGNLKLIIDFIQFNNTSIIDYDYYNLLYNRIKKEKENYDDIFSFLKRFSIIGKKSLTELLKRYYSNVSSNFEWIYEDCIDANLIKPDGNLVYTSFFNELIYEIIEQSTSNHIKAYHQDLIKPFRELYPAQYYKLSEYMYKAGMINEANKAMLLHHLLYFIDFSEIYPLIEDDPILSLSDNAKVYNDLIEAYKEYFKGNYSRALDMTEFIFTCDLEWRFEIDYLKAQIITNGENSVSYLKECKSILKNWVTNDDFKSSHTEMWLRAALHLIDILYELNTDSDLDFAENLYSTATKMIIDYAKYDEYYEFKYYSLNLKANIYHKSEIALKKIKKSNLWFKEHKINYIMHYYISQLNLSSCMLIMCENQGAYEICKEAKELNIILSKFKELFKNEILFNNYLLSAYRSENMSLKEIIIYMEKYIDLYKECADYLLMKNNLVVYYFLNDELEKAYYLSEQLYNMLHEDSDVYYAYFINNNYLFISYLYLGLYNEEAKKYVVTHIPLEKDGAYFKKRNKIISNIIEKNSITLKQGSYTSLSKEPYIGQAWGFWGNYLLFSDLQTWSDC